MVILVLLIVLLLAVFVGLPVVAMLLALLGVSLWGFFQGFFGTLRDEFAKNNQCERRKNDGCGTKKPPKE